VTPDYTYFFTNYSDVITQGFIFGMLLGGVVGASGYGLYMIMRFFHMLAS
jgi:hypothetical protein